MPDISGLTATDITFKVTPDVLNAKATDVQQKVKQLSDRFDSVTQRVKATAGYWQGDAANARRERYEELNSDVPELLQALNGYAVKLNTIAGNYAQAEQEIRQALETLPSDVIF